MIDPYPRICELLITFTGGTIDIDAPHVLPKRTDTAVEFCIQTHPVTRAYGKHQKISVLSGLSYGNREGNELAGTELDGTKERINLSLVTVGVNEIDVRPPAPFSGEQFFDGEW